MLKDHNTLANLFLGDSAPREDLLSRQELIREPLAERIEKRHRFGRDLNRVKLMLWLKENERAEDPLRVVTMVEIKVSEPEKTVGLTHLLGSGELKSRFKERREEIDRLLIIAIEVGVPPLLKTTYPSALDDLLSEPTLFTHVTRVITACPSRHRERFR